MNKKILIISDGKPGHLNQSIAFAKIKQYDYTILEIEFKSKLFKSFGYLFSKIGIFTTCLFEYEDIDFKNFDAVAGAGSSTYYFIQYIAKKYDMRSIAIMLPKGFDYDKFDHIIAQEHDNPPKLDNIISLPVNLSVNEPRGFIQKGEKRSVGIIIGGDNQVFHMDVKTIKKILDEIMEKYAGYDKYITTSRRTPLEVEKLIQQYDFEYKLIYSKQPESNPIPDFIDICDELFITVDSTSMLSEARANSDAKINIVMLESDKKNTKFHKIAQNIRQIDHKIDFVPYLEQIKL